MSLCFQKIKAVPKDRRDDIQSRFENFIKNGGANSAQPNQNVRVFTSENQFEKFEPLLEEISHLREKTTEFTGPHDSPTHRGLRQSCSKIQMKLDDFLDDVPGQPMDSYVKARLIKTLEDVQQIESSLNAKVHFPKCPKCT